MRREGEDVTLAVLAGGQGRRLGGACKGLIEIEGRTILERILDLRSHVAEVLLVADDAEAYARFGLRTVPDLAPDRGAPGGLGGALAAAWTDWVLLIACDMPFVSPDALALLLGERGDADLWSLFETAERLVPMPGLYHRQLLPVVERLLPQQPSFRRLLEEAPGRRIPAQVLSTVDPELRIFTSVNSPDDLLRVRGRLPT